MINEYINENEDSNMFYSKHSNNDMCQWRDYLHFYNSKYILSNSPTIHDAYRYT